MPDEEKFLSKTEFNIYLKHFDKLADKIDNMESSIHQKLTDIERNFRDEMAKQKSEFDHSLHQLDKDIAKDLAPLKLKITFALGALALIITTIIDWYVERG